MATGRRRVVWSRSARDDLRRAIAFVADDSPEAGARLLERILDAASSLAMLSERGRSVREVSDSSIREVLPPPYRLIYRVTDSSVQILAIVHQRRDDPPGDSWELVREARDRPYALAL